MKTSRGTREGDQIMNSSGFLHNCHLVKREGFWLCLALPLQVKMPSQGTLTSIWGRRTLRNWAMTPCQRRVMWVSVSEPALPGTLLFLLFIFFPEFTYDNHDLSWASIISIFLMTPEHALGMQCGCRGMFSMHTHTHTHALLFPCRLLCFSLVWQNTFALSSWHLAACGQHATGGAPCPDKWENQSGRGEGGLCFRRSFAPSWKKWLVNAYVKKNCRWIIC